MNSYQQQAQGLIEQLEQVLRQEQAALQPHGAPLSLPEDLRWQLMVLACSVEDHNLWLHKQDAGWLLTEVETGVQAHGETAAKACANYFQKNG